MIIGKYTISIFLLSLLMLIVGCKRTIEFDPNDLIDARDNNRYSTVMYGDQRWMAENLSYNLNNSKVNPDNPFTEYGRLYTFEQASAACPSGWHLPTDRDWQKMERHLGVGAVELGFVGYRGGSISIGLKSSTGWLLKNGTNEYKFNVYPAGLHDSVKGGFEYITEEAFLWTSKDAGNGKAFYRGLTKNFNGVYRDSIDKNMSLSCRCVKD